MLFRSDPLPLAARAEIGRGAASTRGNAAEARAWIAARGLRTVAVVTAYYHMPRALAELSRAVPGVAWAPYPVPNPPRGAPLRAVAGEYTKYLAAASGLSAWLPAREAAKGGNG